MPHRRNAKWGGYVVSLLTVLAATGLCALVHRWFELSNLIMIYLAAVVIVSTRFGIGEAVLTSVLSVAAFDLLFVPPRYTFAVADAQYAVTFAVMLAVALLISTLGVRLRRQAAASAEREARTAALYGLSRMLSDSKSAEDIAAVAHDEIREVFAGDTAVFLGDRVSISSKSRFEEDALEREAVRLCVLQNEIKQARAHYFPLRGASGALGAIGFLPERQLEAFQTELLETFANTVGAAIDRAHLARESQDARYQAESEEIRNVLLSSISHDLRTPLTSIAGAASALREGAGDRVQLADTIYHEAIRLNLEVQNLLDMTRLQSGTIQPRLEWHSLEEIVGSALRATSELLTGRAIDVRMDQPLVRVDQELMQKVFENILENAAAHTPPGTPISISARSGKDRVYVEFADRGPGLAKGEEAEIFDRFTRKAGAARRDGFGLGLAICRAVMKLHGGRIWAKNREGGGAVFVVEIRTDQSAPEVPRG